MIGSYELLICSCVALHVILMVVDYIFKTCMFTPYIRILKSTGIRIGFLQVASFTTYFNRCIYKLSTYRPKYQSVWFIIGVWFSLTLLPFAFFFFLQSIYASFVNWTWKGAAGEKGAAPFLEPAVPGRNIPIADAVHYIITLVTCVVFHELGHALAAVSEGISVKGVGFMLLLFIPLCYVELEGMDTLTAIKRLKIECAGVWHNIVLVFAVLLLSMSYQWILFPFYEFGVGVQVTSIKENSTLYGTGGLKYKNVITHINHCAVKDYDTWRGCIENVISKPVVGYCLTSEFVHEHDESIRVVQTPFGSVECCRNNSPSHVCFEYMEESGDPIELPPYSCLNVRMVVHSAQKRCQSTGECGGVYCLKPSLPNMTKISEISRKNQDVVLFEGHPALIYKHVTVTEYIQTGILPSSVAEHVQKFCAYLFSISGAFAVINIMPCFYVDGYHIIISVVNLSFLTRFQKKSTRLAISLSITILGSFFLVASFLFVILSEFFPLKR